MQAPAPQLPLPPRTQHRSEAEGKRDATSIVPGTHTGKSKKKGAAKGKKGAKSDELDRVVREDAGLSALAELTREENDDRRSRGLNRRLDGEACEQPPGHVGGFFPLEGHAFRRRSSGGLVPPAYSDVTQGNLSDAWLLAALAAVAHALPSRLTEGVEELGEGAFMVSLGGELLRVTAELPTEGYADPRPNGQEDTLWVALFEKAFALVEAGSYAHLECGNPSRALEGLTGRRARRRALTAHVDGDRVWTDIVDAVSDPRPVVVTTKDVELPRPLVGDHTYAVLGATERDGERWVRLYNPWGTKGGTRPLEEVTHELALTDLLKIATALHIG